MIEVISSPSKIVYFNHRYEFFSVLEHRDENNFPCFAVFVMFKLSLKTQISSRRQFITFRVQSAGEGEKN